MQSKNSLRKRIFDVIQIGHKGETASEVFDIFITAVILINLGAVVFSTYDISAKFAGVISGIELVTVIIFTIEYLLRLWTADYLYPEKSKAAAVLGFIISFEGVIELVSILPFYLPGDFPVGVVAFRIFRVIRIFRLFSLNSKYDAFNVITDVIKDKKNQIASSVFMIITLMVAASLLMYSVEHEAQPEVFKNAFSGIWWATSTLLTIGYGDIYPVTIAGKALSIVISFLGVGMVAIPTGIISAGFVEQYTKVNKLISEGEEMELQFVASTLMAGHPWCGCAVKDIVFPPEMILAAVVRDEEEMTPKGDVVLLEDDVLIMCGRDYSESGTEVKKITIKKNHKWAGSQVKMLDISRQELVVMILRGDETLIPKGDTVIKDGDTVILYSKHYN